MPTAQADSLAHCQAFHPIFVVADEDKRGASKMALASKKNAHIQDRIFSQRRHGGAEQRKPFAAAEALLLLVSVMNDVRIKTEAGVVDKHAAIDLADVDAHGFTCRDLSDRGIRSIGNPRSLAK